GPVRQRAGGLVLRVKVDELVLPDLALDNRLTEGRALAAVGHGLVERDAGPAERRGAGDEPLGLEVLHEVHEPEVLFAEQVTRAPSRTSPAVSLAWLPTFLSSPATENPGTPAGTRKNEQPCAPASGAVLASSVTNEARVPLVTNVFCPSRTYSPPSLRAVVR